MDENKTNEEGKKEEPAETEDAGGKYKTTPVIERAREERERTEAVVKELKFENDRREKLRADELMGSTAGRHIEPEKPKKMSDTEYSEALEKGEVNPLKEDGLI